MGFPGVGLALRRLPADRVDPARWPARRSRGRSFRSRSAPYGEVLYGGIGWGVELVWLPTDGAGFIGPALPGARPSAARSLTGKPPRDRTRRAGAYRTRVSVAIGRDRAAARSRSRRPALAGVGGSTVRYSYEPGSTPEATGQFRGDEAWPGEALRLAGAAGPVPARRASPPRPRSSASCPCAPRPSTSPKAYQLFDLERGVPVPLVVRGGVFSPARSLPRGDRCGRGATPSSPRTRACSAGVTSPTCGSSPPRAPATSISSRPHAVAPAVLDALLPLCAALVALAFAALLLRSLRRRRSGEKVLWALGFMLFGVAASCEAAALRAGWSPALFRAYYLAGRV